MTDSVLPEGYWMDGKGSLIPIAKIKQEHQLEDALVKDLAAEADEIHRRLAAFKERAFGEIEALRDLLAEKYGAKRGGRKGNITFTSFDGTQQVVVAVAEHITFGPELEAAKSLIDECFHSWLSDANANLKVVVDDAFQVDKKGKISTSRVLGLRRHAIEDEKWLRAMDAIADAVRVTGTKAYVRVYRRDPATEDREPVSLDIASV
ncbi:DUF3164 family protein [Roseibium litorale]|uniref:DUF3164 family protein n=1 Tax=Roseibium litorale TaxID=2803841 RepID=A0ABR9CJT8_9HYPH|nr:DUF3164 family protein [Roseibium litorale]MBD8890919.1 DUF3164 family protein [Roseibium litorale]